MSIQHYTCFCILLFLAACTLAEAPSRDAPPMSEEMKNISNRSNLAGWEGDPRLWSVRDGFIHGETTLEVPIKSNSFLIWRDGIAKDFELRLSFRCSPGGNSGILFRAKRTTDLAKKNLWSVRGYQFKVRNENVLPDTAGFLYDEGGNRGRMCMVGEVASMERSGKKLVAETMLNAVDFKKLMKTGTWNEAIIVAKGNNIKHYLNDRLVVDFTDNSPELSSKEGVLALQLSTGKPMWVEFKDLRLLEITDEDPKKERDASSEPNVENPN